MTPYNHYPRVSLTQCRCLNCGWTTREILQFRIWEKKKRRYTPAPKYVQRRRHPPMFRTEKRAHLTAPPYKQRRLVRERTEKILASFKDPVFIEV
jgi:hypothetical protein